MATPLLVNGATGVSNTAIPVGALGAMRLISVSIYNPSAAAAFVQVYDTAAAPTVGTTAPKVSFGLNTLSTRDLQLTGDGMLFQAGMWIAATTTAGGNTAPSAPLNVNLSYSPA